MWPPLILLIIGGAFYINEKRQDTKAHEDIGSSLNSSTTKIPTTENFDAGKITKILTKTSDTISAAMNNRHSHLSIEICR